MDNNTESTALVPTTSTEVSLGKALHDNVRFAKPILRGDADPAGARWLAWATGNNDCYAANGKTPLPPARGWYIDKPDEDEMYPDDFALMDAMQILVDCHLAQECVVMRNDKESGTERRVPSWHLPVASLFIVAQGLPSKKEMADPKERWGIAYNGWSEGAKSSVQFYAFVKELLDVGYNGVFNVKFSSFCTDPALKCLSAQYYVLKVAEEMREALPGAEALAFYAYALPIQCSVKTITAKDKKTGKSKQVFYPIPAVPYLRKSREAALEYLASMAITYEQALVLEDDERVERTVLWSVAASQHLIASPEDSEAIPDTGYVPVGPDGQPIESPF